MATAITFRTSLTPDGGDAILLDAALNQDFNDAADVTDHPVESGIDVADHVRKKPTEYTLDGVISDTPIGSEADAGRSVDVYGTLLRLQESGTLFTITTSKRVLEDMVLLGLRVAHSKDTGGGAALRFTAQLKQIRIVSTQKVAVSSDPRARGKVNGGKKTAAPAKQTPPSSVASLGFHAFAGGAPTGAGR